jgi:hypothetical protein
MHVSKQLTPFHFLRKSSQVRNGFDLGQQLRGEALKPELLFALSVSDLERKIT